MAKKRTIEAKISADNEPLKRGLKDSQSRLNNFKKTVGKVSKSLGIMAGGLAIGAVVKGLFNMAKETGQTADRLLDLEQITGLSTDRLQEYEHVARVAGVNSETLANAVIGLTQRLSRGAQMSASLKQGLEALNIEVFKSDGSMKDLGDVTEQALTQLSEMENVTQRNVIGAQLFSGAWKDLAPILSLGADGLEAAKKEARDLGLVMDKESLKAANDFRIETEILNAEWKVMKREIGLGIIPALQGLIKYSRQAYEGFKILIGVTDRFESTFGTPQEQVDEFLSTIDNIIDTEERRAKIAQETIYLRNKGNELLKSEDKTLQKTGQSMRDQATILQDNYEKYVQLKAEEIKAAEAAAEAERLAAAEAERERIEALGEIGRLQEEIKQTEATYIAANSNADRIAALQRIEALKQELELLEAKARIGAGGGMPDNSGLIPMAQTGEAPTLDDNHAQFLQQMSEKEMALRNVDKAAEKTGDQFSKLSEVGLSAAEGLGRALGDIASEGRQSTGEIIKQMMMQTTAMLIRSIIPAVPFPANLALAAGAGLLSSGLFNQVPGYADGTNFHGGGLAMVGEKGPELVNLPRGSAVHTNRESMGMMNGGEVVFRIQGQELYGVLKRYNSRLKNNT